MRFDVTECTVLVSFFRRAITSLGARLNPPCSTIFGLVFNTAIPQIACRSANDKPVWRDSFTAVIAIEVLRWREATAFTPATATENQHRGQHNCCHPASHAELHIKASPPRYRRNNWRRR